MKQFILCLALIALCINDAAGRAVSKQEQKHEEHSPEQQDDVAVRFIFNLFFTI